MPPSSYLPCTFTNQVRATAPACGARRPVQSSAASNHQGSEKLHASNFRPRAAHHRAAAEHAGSTTPNTPSGTSHDREQKHPHHHCQHHQQLCSAGPLPSSCCSHARPNAICTFWNSVSSSSQLVARRHAITHHAKPVYRAYCYLCRASERVRTGTQQFARQTGGVALVAIVIVVLTDPLLLVGHPNSPRTITTNKQMSPALKS